MLPLIQVTKRYQLHHRTQIPHLVIKHNHGKEVKQRVYVNFIDQNLVYSKTNLLSLELQHVKINGCLFNLQSKQDEFPGCTQNPFHYK